MSGRITVYSGGPDPTQQIETPQLQISTQLDGGRKYANLSDGASIGPPGGDHWVPGI